jgi:hypothetical protein
MNFLVCECYGYHENSLVLNVTSGLSHRHVKLGLETA